MVGLEVTLVLAGVGVVAKLLELEVTIVEDVARVVVTGSIVVAVNPNEELIEGLVLDNDPKGIA